MYIWQVSLQLSHVENTCRKYCDILFVSNALIILRNYENTETEPIMAF